LLQGNLPVLESSIQKGASVSHELLSAAFVGVWANPLPGIPKLSQQVLMNLFSDPYTTTIGVSPEGLIVQKMGKPPTPTVLFGPTRFQVLAPTVDETARVLKALLAEAHTRMSQQIPYLQNIGINTEHQWVRQKFAPSARWLADQYVRKGLTVPPDGAIVEAINLNFVVHLGVPERTYNVQLQPRAEKENGVFAAINDHREWNMAVPGSDKVIRLLNESVLEIQTSLAPLLLGGLADES